MEQQPQGYVQPDLPPAGFFEKNRMLIKCMVTGILTLLMLIPAAFIQELVSEREQRQQQVIDEVSGIWAGPQLLKGPVLMIPYAEPVVQSDNRTSYVRKMAYFMPLRLDIDNNISPHVRHRSIYDVTLYNSQMALSGSFAAPDFAALNIPPGNVYWNEARLVVGISDLRGLEEDIHLQWNDSSETLEAGVPDNGLLSNGLSKQVKLAPGQPVSFSMNIHLKGSQNLSFVPVGKTTKVHMVSSWPNPSFEGMSSTQPATITEKGFESTWNILQVNTGIPQSWKDANVSIDHAAFGVKLLQPTDGYAKTQRSVKYALLFIGLTFTIFFFIEVLQKKQVHPLQYLLVGFALCVFYVLLLSITEYSGFNSAYLIAATATVALIGMYAWSIFQKGRIALLFTAALAGLYAYIFVLIQLQDYALLCGSIGLFFILAIVMYYSRKIDWYGTLRQPAKSI
jgi:inner membrane protein